MKNEKSEKNSLGLRLVVMVAVVAGFLQTEVKESLLDAKKKSRKAKGKIKKTVELLCKKCQSS